MIMQDCENISTCGFFKKYKVSKSLAVNGFINTYCKSDMQTTCKRKVYKKNNGTPPPDEMMPNGLMLKD